MPRNPNPQPASPAHPEPEKLSYEQALGELERLVQAMESAQMPLDQMLVSYRRGSELLQLCHGRLQAVEEQVKLLDDGQLKPWAPT
ncbi:MAG: exodeoxyribonuclease VII small subunit [Rubrivivax sp.]